LEDSKAITGSSYVVFAGNALKTPLLEVTLQFDDTTVRANSTETTHKKKTPFSVGFPLLNA
jgi:hypothetical protein